MKQRHLNKTLSIIGLLLCIPLFPAMDARAQISINREKADNSSTQVNNSETLLSVLNLKILGTEKELEDRVRRILTSQLDSPYSLIVKITIDQEAFKQRINVFGVGSNLRTLPANNNDGASRYVRNLSIEDIFSLIKKIRVSLTIDTSISKAQETNLKNSIFTALNLSEARQDSVEIERTDMMSSSFKSKEEAFNREQQSQSFQNKRLEIMLKELEIQNKKLSTKDSDKGSSDLLFAEMRRISDELKEIRRMKETDTAAKGAAPAGTVAMVGQKTDDKDPQDPLHKVKKIIQGLELPITLLPLGLLLALVLLKMAGGHGKTAMALKGGLEELGKSVQAMADTLAAAAKSVSGESGGQGAAAQAAAQEAQKSEQGSGEGHSLELLQADANQTWKLLTNMPYFLLSVLKDWLVSTDNREKFLQVTEAVGAENAAWIWSKFPSEEIEQLGPLLNKPIAKATSFGSVSLLYRATVREAGAKPDYASKIQELESLITLTDTQLSTALSASTDAEIAAVLSLLTPQRASRMINALGEKITLEVFKSLESAGSLSAEQMQATISAFKQKVDPGSTSKSNLILLPCIVRILESQDSASQEAAKEFLAQNGSLAAEVRKRVITFDEVMSLDSETQYELFGSLTPQDAASLMSVLTQTDREKIEKFFAGKARLQIQDELKKIEAKKRAKKQAKIQADKLKATVLRKVRSMRDQGLIDFEVTQGGEGQNNGNQVAS